MSVAKASAYDTYQDLITEYLNRMLVPAMFYQPHSIFFEPIDDRFVNYMKTNYAQHHIVDCGAGKGFITQLLSDNGFSVTGIDIYPDMEPIARSIYADAALYSWTENEVALICRPCRGSWIHCTMYGALMRNIDVVYVGKTNHYDEDLKPLEKHFKIELIMTKAGIDNENIWRISNV